MYRIFLNYALYRLFGEKTVDQKLMTIHGVDVIFSFGLLEKKSNSTN